MPSNKHAPKFKRIAPGDYEAAGVFRLLQLDGGDTRAWNVEWTTDFEYDHQFEDRVVAYPVDGAATRHDALALFANWWVEHADEFPEATRYVPMSR